MTDYDKLRELAEKATPGPWEAEPLDGGAYGLCIDPVRADLEGLGRRRVQVAGSTFKPNAEFIAAANPATILALLGELRDAKARAWDECALWFDNNALDLGSYEVPTAIKANPYREEA